jgi:hypothetical protein
MHCSREAGNAVEREMLDTQGNRRREVREEAAKVELEYQKSPRCDEWLRCAHVGQYEGEGTPQCEDQFDQKHNDSNHSLGIVAS